MSALLHRTTLDGGHAACCSLCSAPSNNEGAAPSVLPHCLSSLSALPLAIHNPTTNANPEGRKECQRTKNAKRFFEPRRCRSSKTVSQARRAAAQCLGPARPSNDVADEHAEVPPPPTSVAASPLTASAEESSAPGMSLQPSSPAAPISMTICLLTILRSRLTLSDPGLKAGAGEGWDGGQQVVDKRRF
ncbi:hypothetical protein GALMADRAFT_145838 [Galerina marginata CBS 339.88]|uniref:Uncharacterized protein n=1 Tax=Galerina marginata (strain CBS 339.88) TaxID=685588 RepID=A0A067SN48_GALM3|nr:hypothetical protein GALMADRAFT_145838 [Galerina marginata CBS 339.88]